MKPDAPIEIRGEFKPIAHAHAGHPDLRAPAASWRSGPNKWALVRSLTHGTNEHSLGHHVMLTGHSELPLGL